MNRKQEFAMYIMLIFLPAAVMQLILVILMGVDGVMMFMGLFNPLCLFNLLIGFALVYVVYWLRNNYFNEEIEFSEINTDSSEEGYSVESRSKKRKKSGFLNIFSSEDECDTCGTEMEYKEGMDCYYCPECHEYK